MDGFDGDNIYKFQGGYYHGCPKCFPYKNLEEPFKEDPLDNLHRWYERTKAKIQKLFDTPFGIIALWECEFRKTKHEINGLKHLDQLPILKTLPLKPSQASLEAGPAILKCTINAGRRDYTLC